MEPAPGRRHALPMTAISEFFFNVPLSLTVEANPLSSAQGMEPAAADDPPLRRNINRYRGRAPCATITASDHARPHKPASRFPSDGPSDSGKMRRPVETAGRSPIVVMSPQSIPGAPTEAAAALAREYRWSPSPLLNLRASHCPAPPGPADPCEGIASMTSNRQLSLRTACRRRRSSARRPRSKIWRPACGRARRGRNTGRCPCRACEWPWRSRSRPSD
jgi:hypothetical protein